METHKIDSIIKKAISQSENYYDSDANNARERVWNHIQFQKQNQSKPIMIRLLVAATILLFISLSIVTISNIRNRNTINSLVDLNHKLRNEETIKSKETLIKEPKIATNVTIHDTVFIEKKIVEYKPLVTITQNTDTVYVQQIVYVEKEQKPDLLITNKNNSSSDSIFRVLEDNDQSKLHISKTESMKKEKVRKIRIKFGGNTEPKTSGTLVLTANL